jgi:hypothetical protein
MFEQLTPPTDMPLTMMTSRLVIEGTISTRARRVVDLVNEAGSVHLIVHEAMFMDLQSGKVLDRAEWAQIWLDDLLLLHTRTPIESDAPRTAKQPTPATLVVAPFTVQGLIHLPVETDLRMALDAYTDRFVAVTEGKYWLNDEPDSPIAADLLVVNHHRAHVSIAYGTEWKTVSGAALADTRQNPW